MEDRERERARYELQQMRKRGETERQRDREKERKRPWGKREREKERRVREIWARNVHAARDRHPFPYGGSAVIRITMVVCVKLGGKGVPRVRNVLLFFLLFFGEFLSPSRFPPYDEVSNSNATPFPGPKPHNVYRGRLAATSLGRITGASAETSPAAAPCPRRQWCGWCS